MIREKYSEYLIYKEKICQARLKKKEEKYNYQVLDSKLFYKGAKVEKNLFRYKRLLIGS